MVAAITTPSVRDKRRNRVTAPEEDVDTLFSEAVGRHRTGDLAGADALYRRVLDQAPHHADALHLRGMIAQQTGHSEAAIDLIAQAIRHHPARAAFYNTLGNAHAAAGRLEEAAENYRRAVALDPESPAARSNLGNALKGLGRLMEAVASYHAALKLAPRAAEIHCNLGTVLAALERVAEAAAHFERALALDPGLAPAHHNLGLARMFESRFEEAEACFVEARHRSPADAAVHRHLADALSALGRHRDAADSYRETLRLDPGDGEAQRRLGDALSALDRDEEALEHFRAAVEIAPDDADVHFKLANSLKRLGAYERAADHYRRSLELEPDQPGVLCNLGAALAATGKLDEAAAAFARATVVEPDLPEAYNNLANVRKEQGRREDALALYDRAVELRPEYADARFNRAQMLLLMGDWERGWREYEWRYELLKGPLPRVPLPIWDGAPLEGRSILVIGEQAVGDVVMFAHCLPDLVACRGSVTLHCEPRLRTLLQRSFPAIRVATGTLQDLVAGDDPPDVVVGIGSLPRFFRPDEASYTRTRRHITADRQAVKRWRRRYAALGPGLKVGVSWRGGKSPAERRLRTLCLDDWLPVFAVPGIRFVNLQYGERAPELKALADRHEVTVADWPGAVDDLDDFAAQIEALDLVISVANTTVHFAGALAKPVWVLVPAAPSWRWQLNRPDCLFYPTSLLIRQAHGERWAPVIERVAARLARWAEEATREANQGQPALPKERKP